MEVGYGGNYMCWTEVAGKSVWCGNGQNNNRSWGRGRHMSRGGGNIIYVLGWGREKLFVGENGKTGARRGVMRVGNCDGVEAKCDGRNM